ncbi:MAG TPA: TetR/AcrR family transcriptional regulator, partial [Solimonas sp.]|nr:TetR/AcrR family transcriptional regulator [Solimonas sp.]
MASKRLNSTRRQKRALNFEPPSRKGNIKVPIEGWINCARVLLIEEGLAGIKVDRLAKRLRVTRGGFYHHFESHHDLLQALLKDWRLNNCFVPKHIDTASPALAIGALREMTDNLVHERGFDPQFDMAVREWARISQPVADVVEQVDADRVDALGRIFGGLGYAEREASLRAKLFYWQQIGYYAIGMEDPVEYREQNLEFFHQVLGGAKYLDALKAAD